MTIRDTRVYSAIAGGLGGFVSWALIEPLFGQTIDSLMVSDLSRIYQFDALFGALAGVSIGLALGVAEGIILRSWRRVWRGALICGLTGVIGGAIGLVIGETVYQPLKLCCFVGRSLGWGVFGAVLGLAVGVTRRSWLGTRSAALGGLIGGLIGGFVFDLIGIVVALIVRSGAVSRVVALVIVGACIGLFIVIVERALAHGWLKVISGRFEGKDFILDKPLVTMGCDERCDVALFADPAIQGQHATIKWEGGRHVVEAAPGATLLVNKQPTSHWALQHEDTLQIGNTRLLYRSRKVEAARPAAQMPVPIPPAKPTPAVATPPPAPTPRPVPRVPAALPTALVDTRSGQRYPLPQFGRVTLGRHPNNNIVFDSDLVSGHHAEIGYENGRFVLYDLGSTNGTFVNGRKIAGPNMLKAGFRMQIGDVNLMVE
ncbi:MAG: FHA domain-containing protein [Anaerolineae bacterium]